MHRPALPDTPAFQQLRAHYATASQWQMRTLFAEQPERFSDMSLEAAGLFLDYSKNRLKTETLRLLCSLAREQGVEQLRDRMFAGEKINTTEDRAVLHVALRAPVGPLGMGPIIDGEDVNFQVHAVLARMRHFSEQVRSGEWRGSQGKAIETIVNIGIGGSFLGPKMAITALRPLQHPRLAFHFVSNVDANELDALLPTLDPHTTLFIIASKTFTTAETMRNAHTARDWLVARCGTSAPAQHFVAVSTNTEAVTAFGIDADNMFGFWDWVGGRYSVWSAVGLSVMLAIGADSFDRFLAGAHAMDRHFRDAPLERNMPVLLAMIGVWYRNFFGYDTLSIAPYWQDLQFLPGYLQQLDMESNGKRVDRSGAILRIETAPVIWGDVGTNGQHAYFQMLHQGTTPVPVDFVTVLRHTRPLPDGGAALDPPTLAAHQDALLANCFAQSAALMHGKNADEVREELADGGIDDKAIDSLVPHKTFPGNRPSNTILLSALTPETLGALIALYEHKIFVQGAVWGINSFDQWGVELGKALAKGVQSALTAFADAAAPVAQDSSTAGLIKQARTARQAS